MSAVQRLRRNGVRLFPIGASGVETTAQIVMRTASLLTMGQYRFLTDHSGVGNAHTTPDLSEFAVERLYKLVIHMLASELAGKRLGPQEVIAIEGSERCTTAAPTSRYRSEPPTAAVSAALCVVSRDSVRTVLLNWIDRHWLVTVLALVSSIFVFDSLSGHNQVSRPVQCQTTEIGRQCSPDKWSCSCAAACPGRQMRYAGYDLQTDVVGVVCSREDNQPELRTSRWIFRLNVVTILGNVHGTYHSPDLKAPPATSRAMPAQLFQEYYVRLKTQVDDALRQQLDAQDWPAPLMKAVEYSLMAAGKRLRPVLVLMSNEVCSGTVAVALPAACAIEMIHTYSLIHDDLPSMDDDDLRRGRPTSHVVFGEALAILAGDALLTLAFETLATGSSSAAVTADCLRLLGSAAGGAGMVGGQVLDLEAERGAFQGTNDSADSQSNGISGANTAQAEGRNNAGQPDFSIPSSGGNLIHVEQLSQIHRMKTGALINAALQLGAVLAEAPPEHRECLQDYGSRIGLAFQIADDLLDVTGSNDRLGKETGRDRELGKVTYPSLIGIEASRQKAAALVTGASDALALFGAKADHLVQLAQFIVERDH